MNIKSKLVFFTMSLLSLSIFANEYDSTKGEFILAYTLNSPKEGEKSKPLPTLAGTNCEFKIEPIADHRNNKVTIGAAFKKPLQAKEVDQWLANLSGDLQSIASKSNSVGNSVILKPRMTKLYTYHHGMNIHGVIAVDVDFIKNGVKVGNEYYRALSTKLNWNGAVSEYIETTNRAAYMLTEQIVNDLPNRC